MVYRLHMRALSIVGLLFLGSLSFLHADPEIRIHYLGHASFLLEFDNGISVLTDFGRSNAWGLNSPIYDLMGFTPTILTYSHQHSDHYDTTRTPEGVEIILLETGSLDSLGLVIEEVGVCESIVDNVSSTAFIFNYAGFRICHLSDAQADIMAIADPEQQAHIQEIFPEQFDLLLMTIEGVDQFIPEAEMFVDLLQPKRIIPMHYWSESYKNFFLRYLEGPTSTTYNIITTNSPSFTLSSQDPDVSPVEVISLSPANYLPLDIKDNGRPQKPAGSHLDQNCPNPFNPGTQIRYELYEPQAVRLALYDLRGRLVRLFQLGRQHASAYDVYWDGLDLLGEPAGSGIYICRLETSTGSQTIKLILME